VNQPKVYADITFLINFIMDFMIFWTTAKLGGKPILYGRLFLASFLGGVYGVVYLLPEMTILYRLPSKLLFSCLLVLIAFKPMKCQDWKKILAIFYTVSFVMAGATVAGSYLLNDAQDKSFSYWWLLGGIFFALGLGTYGQKYLAERIIPALLKYPLELHFGNIVCRGEGFLDTGNGLHDPLTKRPVVVAEYDFLKKYIPEDCRVVIDTAKDNNDILQGLSSTSWADRIRVIPFSSIGKKNGLMVGFRCDEIIIDPDKINSLYKNLVVGIYLHKLSTRDNYQLLIPSEIVQKI
jgi:stage II sporulation protein GA (sporulation sigma-E factor processing peptidase)